MDYDPDPGKDDNAQEEQIYQPDESKEGVEAAFQAWWVKASSYPRISVKEASELYDAAVELLEDVEEIDTNHANKLPRTLPDTHEFDSAVPRMGIFLSAAQNASDNDHIVYDTDTGEEQLSYLGWDLDADKTLVVEQPVEELGHTADGTIVINADLNDEGFDAFCYADIVNNAEVEDGVSSPRTILNYNKMDFIYPSSEGLVVNHEHAEKITNTDNGLVINLGTVEKPISYLQNDRGPLPRSAPLGITINYGGATFPEEANGLFIDVDDESFVLYNQKQILSQNESPEHPLWDYLKQLEEDLDKPNHKDVFDALEKYDQPQWDKYEEEVRLGGVYNKPRWSIGHTIEDLLFGDN